MGKQVKSDYKGDYGTKERKKRGKCDDKINPNDERKRERGRRGGAFVWSMFRLWGAVEWRERGFVCTARSHHLMLGPYDKFSINQSITMNGSDKSNITNYLPLNLDQYELAETKCELEMEFLSFVNPNFGREEDDEHDLIQVTVIFSPSNHPNVVICTDENRNLGSAPEMVNGGERVEEEDKR
jgi:hypothetical protein